MKNIDEFKSAVEQAFATQSAWDKVQRCNKSEHVEDAMFRPGIGFTSFEENGSLCYQAGAREPGRAVRVSYRRGWFKVDLDTPCTRTSKSFRKLDDACQAFASTTWHYICRGVL